MGRRLLEEKKKKFYDQVTDTQETEISIQQNILIDFIKKEKKSYYFQI